MKIFNWMHRRLNPKDGLSQNVKKEEDQILTIDAETESLLENVVPADMLQFHGWRGAAILSIGTFGLRDNFSIDEQYMSKDYLGLMGEDQDTESEDDYSDDGDKYDSDGEDYEQEWNPLVHDKSGAPRPDPEFLSPNNVLLQHCSYSDHTHNSMKKKARITLADLFSADSDHAGCKTPPPLRSGKKSTPDGDPARGGPPKNGALFAKKLIPRFKEDSRPIQKLQGLMKRMLKRKIHPDVTEGKNKGCTAGNGIPSGQFGISESVSLLQSQDATL